MGWEQRGNRTYYYRKERKGSRVRSVYVGGGETAVLIAQLENIRREESRTEHTTRQREIISLEKHEKAIDALCKMNDDIIEAMLLVAGFHTHKRQWRKSRSANLNQSFEANK